MKNYFIPHQGNDYKPHLLRARSVVFVLIVAVVVEGIFLFGTSTLAPNSKLFGIIVANALVDETNQSRASNDVSALTVSPLLQAAAQEKADDMVANNYFAHTSPSGLTPWYWFGQVGYNFLYAGENLAVNFSDSQDVTDAWMNSPEHRANILDTNYTQIGIATASGTYEGRPAVYVVELFGTPVPPAPPAEPIAFVNSAAAASVPAARPKTKSAPTVVATSSVGASGSAETFVGVSQSLASSTATTTASSVPVLSTAALINIQPDSNPIQRAASDPRQLLNYIYLAIIALFAAALIANAFVKVHIAHPQFIFAGMLVIVVVGLFIVLNQHVLAATAIL